MKVIPLTIAALLIVSFLNVPFAQNATKIEQQFLDLENKWMNAWKNKDEKACREILAPDFTLTSSISTGELITKEQWVGALSKYDCKSFQFDKIKVRIYGKTAVVNSWYHQEAIANGRDWNGKFLMTDVWVKKRETGRLSQDMQAGCKNKCFRFSWIFPIFV